MTAKTIMVQGTASSVGKSIIVAALCRIFKQDGFRVAPFKSQNMALNSFVTREGGEIGRAQAVQAEAAGIEPSVHMNPVLIKPEADARAQIIVLGKVYKTLQASQYYMHTPYLTDTIKNSLQCLRAANDIVVIEGAGSPAEINLKDREIVNMYIAHLAEAPVLLAGDIDRGGVFASLVGTLELLSQDERDLIKGFIINKFRGDVTLLKPGLDFLKHRTGKPVLGVIPYYRDINIAQEDSVYLDERQGNILDNALDIAIIRLPHISNYDDFDPLEDQGCMVRYITNPSELGHPDLIIVPGTKSTMADLMYLHRQELTPVITQLASAGTPVIGICGGYQMLGKKVIDPDDVESSEKSCAGLGLLDNETTFQHDKTTTQIKGRVVANSGLLEGLNGLDIIGYEIHMGQTQNSNERSVFQIIETPHESAPYFDGSLSDNGLVFGTYIHGLFHNTEFTTALIKRLQQLRGMTAASSSVGVKTKDENYDILADLVRKNLDLPYIYKEILEIN